VPGWEIKTSILPSSARINDGGFTACLDAAKAGKKLTVRRRLPGDRFQPLGMAQAKKINRFMIDARLPQAWRNRVPIVCAGGDVLWVAGWRIDERYRVTPDTKKLLRLEFKRP
jgi:tRNA(Ile)-lysidine synthase